MVLGIAEDLTSDVILDADLISVPEGGLYLNSGVHPSITVDNLLAFLPKKDITISEWDSSLNYGVYISTRSRRDLVSKGGVIYQSIKGDNLNNDPSVADDYWIETNIESLRIRNFILQVMDKVLSDISLTKRLINSQYLYEVGENSVSLPNDYCGWGFEPKGSDYVSFRINQMSIQAAGITPINVYVINQGQILATLPVVPQNGQVKFQDVGYVFSGKGPFYFVIDSTTVFTNNGWIDALKYDSFICYSVNGIGNTPQSAKYSCGTSPHGLGFNISTWLDPTIYIENNIANLSAYIRATFEYMTFQMYLHNSNNRSNREQRIQMSDSLLLAEVMDMTNNTSVKRYNTELKQALKTLNKTFDTQLTSDKRSVTIEVGSV